MNPTSPTLCSQDEMLRLERLLLDFEVIKKAVEFHPDFERILRDYPSAEAGIRRSTHVAAQAWQSVILSKNTVEKNLTPARGCTEEQMDKFSSILSVSVYVLSHWLRILEGDPLPAVRVLN